MSPEDRAPRSARSRSRSYLGVVIGVICVLVGSLGVLFAGLAAGSGSIVLSSSRSYLRELEPDREAYYRRRIEAAVGKDRERHGRELGQEILAESLCSMPLEDHLDRPLVRGVRLAMLARCGLALAVVVGGVLLFTAPLSARRVLLFAVLGLVALAAGEAVALVHGLPRAVGDFTRDYTIAYEDLLQRVDPESVFTMPLPITSAPSPEEARVVGLVWFTLLSGPWQLLFVAIAGLVPTRTPA